MKKITKFLLVFIVLSYSASFYLRVIQLNFFYRIGDTFWSGIGATLISVTLLIAVCSVFIIRILNKFYLTVEKVRNGESISDQERKNAIKAYNKINIISVVMNLVGFGVGQVVASFADIANGVILPDSSRLALIFTQAMTVGVIVALYEIFILGVLITEDREVLSISNVSEFPGSFRPSISYKFILATLAILILTAVNCFGAVFQIILQDGGKPVVDAYSEYLANFPLAFFGSIIPGLGLIVILCLDIKKRIDSTNARIKDIGDKGDLSSRISISSGDNIGQLDSNLNDFISNLSKMVKTLRSGTDVVSSTAEELASSANISVTALDEMRNSINKISQEGEKQKQLVTLAGNEVYQVAKNAQEVESQIRSQIVAVQQSSSAVNKMAKSIESVANMAREAEVLSTELSKTSKTGSTSISAAVSSIIEIKKASDEVQMIISSIEDIAQKTNLLSMNAAIEAAHAGTYGQGFAVVAGEVRALAASSSQSAQNIQKHILEMIKKIENGVSSIQAAGKAFTEINSGIENTSNLIKTISSAMTDQRIGADETIKSTTVVVDAIKQIQQLSSQQLLSTDNVKKSIEQIVDAAQDIGESIVENMRNSSNVESAIKRVDECVNKNTNAVKGMQKQINVFKA